MEAYLYRRSLWWNINIWIWTNRSFMQIRRINALFMLSGAKGWLMLHYRLWNGGLRNSANEHKHSSRWCQFSPKWGKWRYVIVSPSSRSHVQREGSRNWTMSRPFRHLRCSFKWSWCKMCWWCITMTALLKLILMYAVLWPCQMQFWIHFDLMSRSGITPQ